MKTVVKALVLDEVGNILVLRRNITHPNFPYHFDFPGGEVEANESQVDAVKREIQEETGLIVTLEQLKLAHQKQISKELTHVVYTANVPHDKPPVELSWEHSEFEWVPFDTLATLPIPDGVDAYYLTVLDYVATI